MKKETLKSVMKLAWQFVKKNGFSMSEALKVAWMNIKLRAQMKLRIVKFYFQKVDGTLREAYGSLSEDLLPVTKGESTRKSNDTLQVYFDTEKQSFRSFKKANLVRIA
jgi:hypothetical protein